MITEQMAINSHVLFLTYIFASCKLLFLPSCSVIINAASFSVGLNDTASSIWFLISTSLKS